MLMTAMMVVVVAEAKNEMIIIVIPRIPFTTTAAAVGVRCKVHPVGAVNKKKLLSRSGGGAGGGVRSLMDIFTDCVTHCTWMTKSAVASL